MCFDKNGQCLKLAVSVLISVVFLSAAVGKVLHLSDASRPVANILPMSPLSSSVVVSAIAWSEIAVAVFVWRRVPKSLIAVPLLFAAVYGWSLRQGVECGCFGALPLLSSLSPAAHFMLLAGMFLGLLYLSVARKGGGGNVGKRQRLWLRATGYGAVGLMLAAVLPLPPGALKSNLGSGNVSDAVITRQKVVAALSDSGTVVIDARQPLVYGLGHIPGAVNVPYNREPLESVLVQHGLRHRRVIVYCAGAHCNAAELLARRLRQLGCRNVTVYAGGWEDWQAHTAARQP